MIRVTNIQRISTDSADHQGNLTSFSPIFSPDGTQIAFGSYANNLVTNDTNDTHDVYVKDINTGEITLVSGNAANIQGDNFSSPEAFSPDGTKFVFISRADNLLSGYTAGDSHSLFMKNFVTGEVTSVTDNAIGEQANDLSYHTYFSADGSKVLFWSLASNLVANDTNNTIDLFLKDFSTNTITRVTTNAAGSEGIGGNLGDFIFTNAALSSDNTKVIFQSSASNLVPDDTNESLDVFLKDLITGSVTRVSTNALGEQAIDNIHPELSWGGSMLASFSPDGQKVLFQSFAHNLVADDTNGNTSTGSDIFIKDLLTGSVTRISTDSSGNQANDESWYPQFSPDDTKVLFSSWASNLVADDTNGVSDFFLKDIITGEITRISVNMLGQQTDGSNQEAVFSPDGKHIAFVSYATNLVPDDTNNASDIFLVTLVEDKNLLGGSGKDTLTGAEGNDTISGLEANDKLYGGEGDDSLLGGSGRDLLEGDAGNDTLDGGIGNDTLRGGEGDDFLYGDSGNDTLYSGDGNDFLSGGNSADMLQGEGGSDTLYGGSAADLLRGGDGDDFGFGESGADDLRMGAGDDKLNGGSGADDLYGGIGADIFGFDNQATNGSDKVKDFSLAEGDKIYLEGLLVGFDTLTSDITEYVQFTYSATSSNLWVDIDGIGAAFSFDRIATLENVLGLDAATLYVDGDLVVVT